MVPSRGRAGGGGKKDGKKDVPPKDTVEPLSYLDVARRAQVQDQYKQAKESGKAEVVLALETIHPELAPVPVAPPKAQTPFQLLESATQKALSAQRKADKALDKVAQLVTDLFEARKQAATLVGEAVQQDHALAEARKAHALSMSTGVQHQPPATAMPVLPMQMSSALESLAAQHGSDQEVAQIMAETEAMHRRVLELQSRKGIQFQQQQQHQAAAAAAAAGNAALPLQPTGATGDGAAIPPSASGAAASSTPPAPHGQTTWLEAPGEPVHMEVGGEPAAVPKRKSPDQTEDDEEDEAEAERTKKEQLEKEERFKKARLEALQDAHQQYKGIQEQEAILRQLG